MTDWNLINTDAVEWASKHAGDAFDLTDREKKAVRKVIAKVYRKKGFTFGDSCDMLSKVIGSMDRVELIVSTEITPASARRSRKMARIS